MRLEEISVQSDALEISNRHHRASASFGHALRSQA
jgi:hypothetical protein